MKKAQDIVDNNFDAALHLPPAVYKFLQPIADTTCQGYYSCALMVMGGMAALTNGAAVQVWNQKPSPLVAAVFQVGEAQSGKSRLFAVLDEIFDTCDDVVAEYVHKLVAEKSPRPEVLPSESAADEDDSG